MDNQLILNIKIDHGKNQRANNSIKEVVSVSDTLTTDDKGETIGLIRVISYKE